LREFVRELLIGRKGAANGINHKTKSGSKKPAARDS